MSNELNQFELISKVIRKRRSIFPVQYNDSSIPNDLIDQILELANWAPTHRRTEPWRFVVISGAAKNRLGIFLSETYKMYAPDGTFNPTKQRGIRAKCEQSANIILICMQRDPLERVPEWEEIAAVSMSVQNMWLGCSALGIGAYWSSPMMINHMNEFLNMSQGERCLGLFYIGGFDGEWPAGNRTSQSDRVRFLTS